ncbi:hypothetical protein VTK73DRAFT_8524 [Phialemonium thermophilum]|uniref:Uncharacterized protein n=1 Tax=Phialemonium thermophilum TaxID=223376 RepID=A0ABR3W7Z1_9PEZI
MASVATKARRVLEPAYVRSLFVRVSPIPRSLSERRSVLRALQKYGEIEVFKGLKDPASFISVAAQASTVERLVQNSPLQFDMTPEAPAADPADIASTTSGLASEIALRKALQLSSDPSSLPGSSLEQDVGQELPGLADTATSSSTRGSPAATTFTLHIFPTQNYKHSTTIRYSPLHGPWPTATTGGGDNDDTRPQSFVTAALRLVVPKDMSARGLFDWETGGQAERGGGEYHEIGKREHIRERIERRKLRARAKAGGLLAARKGADGDTETDGPQQVADREKPAGG